MHSPISDRSISNSSSSVFLEGPCETGSELEAFEQNVFLSLGP